MARRARPARASRAEAITAITTTVAAKNTARTAPTATAQMVARAPPTTDRLRNALMEEIQFNHLANKSQLAARECLKGYYRFRALLDNVEPGDLALTLGAGNVWRAGEEFLEAMKKRQ